MSAIDHLKATSLFSGLEEEALERLAAKSNERAFKKGHLVFSQGDPGDALFVLTEGVVKVLITAESGDQMVLTTLSPPATFGELALFDGGPRSASVEVVEPSRLLVIDRRSWDELIEDSPSFMHGLAHSLAALLRRLTDQAADFVFLDLHGRVAKFLMNTARAGGTDSEPARTLDLHLTQGDIAKYVGGSRQSVNQILGHLEGRGYIRMNGRKIEIMRLQALERRAGL